MPVSSLPPLASASIDNLSQRLGLAAEIVAAVRAGRSLNDALDKLHSLTAGMRAGVQELVYGTLRRYGRGDYQLTHLLSKPLGSPEIHALLLVALYRLESHPESVHTVVDQAVDRAGALAGGNFRGLVNGVLRNFLRQREQIEKTIINDDVAHYCYPLWWLHRLQEAYPDDWQALAIAGNLHPPMTLRVNLRKTARDSYYRLLQEAEIVARPLMPDSALLLEKPVNVDCLPDFFSGWVSVQDAGAQWAANLLDARDGMRVLDACAAPGGKTAHLLEKADLDLLALDNNAKRCMRITENLSRLALRAEVKVADCRVTQDWWDGRSFDRILADVPCSASGVVRRHVDAKWLRRESDLRSLATVQRQMLKTLWPLLAPGGKFLYATCSVFPEENGGQISVFLDKHPDARCLDARQLLPTDEHDGFYYALLEKSPP